MNQPLQQYIEGDCTQEEREKVFKWIEENPNHLHEYRIRRRACDILLWCDGLESASEKKITRRFNFKTYIREALKVAAIIALVATSTYFLTKEKTISPQMQTIYVPEGQRAQLTMSDGTKVWLNSGSTLSFPNQFSDSRHRIVKLDGEGYFDVMRHKNQSFTVETAEYDIHVLGTEFNVKAYASSDSFEAALLDGSIEITSPETNTHVALKPNEVALLKSNKLVKKQIDNHSYFRWIDGIIGISDEAVTKLIEKLELYYNVEIEVRNDEFLEHRYTGKFRVSDGIEHVLKVLQVKHKFQYEINEDTNQIIIE